MQGVHATGTFSDLAQVFHCSADSGFRYLSIAQKFTPTKWCPPAVFSACVASVRPGNQPALPILPSPDCPAMGHAQHTFMVMIVPPRQAGQQVGPLPTSSVITSKALTHLNGSGEELDASLSDFFIAAGDICCLGKSLGKSTHSWTVHCGGLSGNILPCLMQSDWVCWQCLDNGMNI